MPAPPMRPRPPSGRRRRLLCLRAHDGEQADRCRAKNEALSHTALPASPPHRPSTLNAKVALPAMNPIDPQPSSRTACRQRRVAPDRYPAARRRHALFTVLHARAVSTSQSTLPARVVGAQVPSARPRGDAAASRSPRAGWPVLHPARVPHVSALGGAVQRGLPSARFTLSKPPASPGFFSNAFEQRDEAPNGRRWRITRCRRERRRRRRALQTRGAVLGVHRPCACRTSARPLTSRRPSSGVTGAWRGAEVEIGTRLFRTVLLASPCRDRGTRSVQASPAERLLHPHDPARVHRQRHDRVGRRRARLAVK